MVSFCAHLAARHACGTAGVIRLLLVTFGVALTLIQTPAADTNAVLNAWLASQTNLQSWTADFTQTRMLKTLTQPLVATGRVWFAPPNRFRWELGQPAQTIALRQADQMFVIYPRLKRAERYPLGGSGNAQWREAMALLEAGFPRDRADLESRFRILSLTETNRAWQLTLQPSSAMARRMMKEIRVGLATNDFSLVSTELVFADDSRMRNDFTHQVLNGPLDKGVFDWTPSPDFKVTEPLGK
jgi:outer membrane lipoprotein-sorting protein